MHLNRAKYSGLHNQHADPTVSSNPFWQKLVISFPANVYRPEPIQIYRPFWKKKNKKIYTKKQDNVGNKDQTKFLHAAVLSSNSYLISKKRF